MDWLDRTSSAEQLQVITLQGRLTDNGRVMKHAAETVADCRIGRTNSISVDSTNSVASTNSVNTLVTCPPAKTLAMGFRPHSVRSLVGRYCLVLHTTCWLSCLACSINLSNFSEKIEAILTVNQSPTFKSPSTVNTTPCTSLPP